LPSLLQDSTHGLFESNIQLVTIVCVDPVTQLTFNAAYGFYLQLEGGAQSAGEADKTTAMLFILEQFSTACGNAITCTWVADKDYSTHRAVLVLSIKRVKRAVDDGDVAAICLQLSGVGGDVTPDLAPALADLARYRDSVELGVPLLPTELTHGLPLSAEQRDAALEVGLSRAFVDTYPDLVRAAAIALSSTLSAAVSTILLIDPVRAQLQAAWLDAVTPLFSLHAALPIDNATPLGRLWSYFKCCSRVCVWHAHVAWQRKLDHSLGKGAAEAKRLFDLMYNMERAPDAKSYAVAEAAVVAGMAGHSDLLTWFHGESNHTSAGWSSSSRWAGMWCAHTLRSHCQQIDASSPVEAWHSKFKNRTLRDGEANIADGGVVVDYMVGRIGASTYAAMSHADSVVAQMFHDITLLRMGQGTVRDRDAVNKRRRHFNGGDGLLARALPVPGVPVDLAFRSGIIAFTPRPQPVHGVIGAASSLSAAATASFGGVTFGGVFGSAAASGVHVTLHAGIYDGDGMPQAPAAGGVADAPAPHVSSTALPPASLGVIAQYAANGFIVVNLGAGTCSRHGPHPCDHAVAARVLHQRARRRQEGTPFLRSPGVQHDRLWHVLDAEEVTMEPPRPVKLAVAIAPRRAVAAVSATAEAVAAAATRVPRGGAAADARDEEPDGGARSDVDVVAFVARPRRGGVSCARPRGKRARSAAAGGAEARASLPPGQHGELVRREQSRRALHPLLVPSAAQHWSLAVAWPSHGAYVHGGGGGGASSSAAAAMAAWPSLGAYVHGGGGGGASSSAAAAMAAWPSHGAYVHGGGGGGASSSAAAKAAGPS